MKRISLEGVAPSGLPFAAASLSSHETEGVVKPGLVASRTSETSRYNEVKTAIHGRFPIKRWPPDNNPSLSKFPTGSLDSIDPKNEKLD